MSPSVSLPGFVIPHPLASLPVSSQHRAGPVAGTLSRETDGTSTAGLAGRGQRALPDGPLPGLVLNVLLQGGTELFMITLCCTREWGRAGVSAFHPPAQSSPPSPNTPLYALCETPFPLYQQKDSEKTQTHTVYSRSSGFVVSVFANSPTA